MFRKHISLHVCLSAASCAVQSHTLSVPLLNTSHALHVALSCPDAVVKPTSILVPPTQAAYVTTVNVRFLHVQLPPPPRPNPSRHVSFQDLLALPALFCLVELASERLHRSQLYLRSFA